MYPEQLFMFGFVAAEGTFVARRSCLQPRPWIVSQWPRPLSLSRLAPISPPERRTARTSGKDGKMIKFLETAALAASMAAGAVAQAAPAGNDDTYAVKIRIGDLEHASKAG